MLTRLKQNLNYTLKVVTYKFYKVQRNIYTKFTFSKSISLKSLGKISSLCQRAITISV